MWDPCRATRNREAWMRDNGIGVFFRGGPPEAVMEKGQYEKDVRVTGDVVKWPYT